MTCSFTATLYAIFKTIFNVNNDDNDTQRYSDYWSELMTWASEVMAKITSQDLAADIAGAETLLSRYLFILFSTKLLYERGWVIMLNAVLNPFSINSYFGMLAV